MARTKIIKPAATKAEAVVPNPESPVDDVLPEQSELDPATAAAVAAAATDAVSPTGDEVVEDEIDDDSATRTSASNKRKSVSTPKTPVSKKKAKRAKVNTPGGPGSDEGTPGGPKTKYTSRDNTVQEIREIAGSLVSNLLGREFPAEAVQFRESKASAKGYSWYVDEGEEFPACFEREGPMRWLAPERNGVLKMLKEGKLGVEAVMMADDENAAEPAVIPEGAPIDVVDEGVLPVDAQEDGGAEPMDTSVAGDPAAPVVPGVPEVEESDDKEVK